MNSNSKQDLVIPSAGLRENESLVRRGKKKVLPDEGWKEGFEL